MNCAKIIIIFCLVFIRYSEMRLNTIRVTGKTTPGIDKLEIENHMRQPNHDGHDNIDSNEKKDEGIEDENVMRQANNAGTTTAGTNHPQFVASVIKQTDQKQDENNDSYKKDEDIEDTNQIKQSDHDGDETKDSNGKDEAAELLGDIIPPEDSLEKLSFRHSDGMN
ncbi:hypothetical protein QYM36_010039 [Artemia franciscana]|uniref:Uncharacterized protein n=1 Tax=Artemia franciscana TaxID=6661 RepID=A0AA88HWD1_ARTSF|nr:hypothetical protein QYM36_010039 [Artemia franciscana]